MRPAVAGPIGQCPACGALVGACQACGELVACPYCLLGISPVRSSRALARQAQTARPRRRSRANPPEREPSFLERVTGLTGDHLAVVGLGAIAALTRAAELSGTVEPRYRVVDGEYREIP